MYFVYITDHRLNCRGGHDELTIKRKSVQIPSGDLLTGWDVGHGQRNERKEVAKENGGWGRGEIPVEFQRFFIARNKPRQLRNRSLLHDPVPRSLKEN